MGGHLVVHLHLLWWIRLQRPEGSGSPYDCSIREILDRRGVHGLEREERVAWGGQRHDKCTAGLCSGDTVCMQAVETCLCFYTQVKIPPEQGAKKCVCCAKDIIA